MIDLRETFIETLIDLADNDPEIILLVPDVGFNFLERFQSKFPDRFFNTGVTEQSTMIIAAGLALAGMKPYVYSMINFVIFRPFEMVRNAVCYHNANVKIFGVKGSEKYKFLGFSHNINYSEDLLAIADMPNIMSYIPETDEQLKENILLEYNRLGPAYTRI